MSYSNSAPPGSPFLAITVGAVATRFGERITRAIHARRGDPTPRWFDPRQHRNHMGIHIGEFSVYLEMEIDEARRKSDHPFDTQVRGAARHTAQLDLFALVDQPCTHT